MRRALAMIVPSSGPTPFFSRFRLVSEARTPRSEATRMPSLGPRPWLWKLAQTWAIASFGQCSDYARTLQLGSKQLLLKLPLPCIIFGTEHV